VHRVEVVEIDDAYFSGWEAGGVQSSLYRMDAGCVRTPESAAACLTLFGAG
jgi:hypothetical protein